MSNYIVSDTELTATAEAVRQKGGTAALIPWQTGTGFADAVGAIPSGGGSSVVTMSPAATGNTFPAAAQAMRDGAYAVIGNNKPFIAVWYSGDQPSNYISIMMDIPANYGKTAKGQTLVGRNGDLRFARMLDYDQVSTSFDYFCSANSVYKLFDLSDMYEGLLS